VLRATSASAGGRVFHFVTDGIEAALNRAHEAADGQDIRLGGGASAIQQYLRAGLLDEMHLAYVPLLLGSGERLRRASTRLRPGMKLQEFVGTPAALYVRVYERADPSDSVRHGCIKK
jgi:dihydrofolate reductase